MGRGWRRPRVPALLARARWRRATAIARRRLCLLVAKIQTGGLKFKTGYKDLYSPPRSWPEPTKEKAPTAVRFCDRGSYGGLRLRFAPSQGPLKRNSHTLVPSRFIDNYPSAKENRCDISAISKRARSRRKDRKSTRLNSSHANISYAVFCLNQKTVARRHDVTSIVRQRGWR